MLYSFARVSAVLGMRRQDYFGQGSRGWLRLYEKGGKRHDVPAHHRAAAALDAYVEAGGLEEPKAALFQSMDPAGRRLTGRALERRLDRGARVSEDDEALRPDGGQGDSRRDRAYRDLNGGSRLCSSAAEHRRVPRFLRAGRWTGRDVFCCPGRAASTPTLLQHRRQAPRPTPARRSRPRSMAAMMTGEKARCGASVGHGA